MTHNTNPPDFAGFKVEARPFFGTVSGSAGNARVFARNKTARRNLLAMAAVYGGAAVQEDNGQYPQLVLLSFTCGCGCGSTQPHQTDAGGGQ